VQVHPQTPFFLLFSRSVIEPACLKSCVLYAKRNKKMNADEKKELPVMPTKIAKRRRQMLAKCAEEKN